jgi:hypothetical protein
MEAEPSDRIQASLSNLEQVAHLAWQRWESEGRPPGRNLDFWSWAEAEVLAGRHRPVTSQSAPRPASPPSAP